MITQVSRNLYLVPRCRLRAGPGASRRHRGGLQGVHGRPGVEWCPADTRGGMSFAQDTLEKKRTVEEDLLTAKDVARLLKMSERWVHERTRRREIPCYRFGTAL